MLLEGTEWVVSQTEFSIGMHTAAAAWLSAFVQRGTQVFQAVVGLRLFVEKLEETECDATLPDKRS